MLTEQVHILRDLYGIQVYHEQICTNGSLDIRQSYDLTKVLIYPRILSAERAAAATTTKPFSIMFSMEPLRFHIQFR